MIAAKRGGPVSQMVQVETFEDFYAKKLEALVVELKAVIYNGIPFATSAEYACRYCQGRLKLHSQCSMTCLLCETPSGLSKRSLEAVNAILACYPGVEESKQEWEEDHQGGTTQVSKYQPRAKGRHIELGEKIQAARLKKKWSAEELSRKICKQNGEKLSKTSIFGYESGWVMPPAHILEQIEKLLEMDG